MDKEKLAAAFNKWMDRYINNPEEFEHQWRSLIRYTQERSGGAKPTYGDNCAEYLLQLMSEG